MRKRTINLILTKKIDAWLDSIDDEDLRKRCRKEVIVTGGCIASMLLGEPINDFDIYLGKKETVKDLAKYYVAKFLSARDSSRNNVGMEVQELKDTLGRDRIRIVVQSAGVTGEEDQSNYEYFEQGNEDGSTDLDSEQYLDEAYNQSAVGEVDEEVRPTKPEYHPVFLSSNAITLKGDIQVIIRFFGGPEEIHENFDFVHCMNYWTRETGVVLNLDSMESLMSRQLVYHGSLYPVASVFRIRKFIERGWVINAGQMLKMCLQISQLDLKNYKVLEEQLTGVDVAYFTEVLKKARKEGKDPNLIETAYIIKIIDRMF